MHKSLKSALCHLAIFAISLTCFAFSLKENCVAAIIIFGVFTAYSLFGIIALLIDYQKYLWDKEDEERLHEEDNEY